MVFNSVVARLDHLIVGLSRGNRRKSSEGLQGVGGLARRKSCRRCHSGCCCFSLEQSDLSSKLLCLSREGKSSAIGASSYAIRYWRSSREIQDDICPTNKADKELTADPRALSASSITVKDLGLRGIIHGETNNSRKSRTEPFSLPQIHYMILTLNFHRSLNVMENIQQRICIIVIFPKLYESLRSRNASRSVSSLEKIRVNNRTENRVRVGMRKIRVEDCCSALLREETTTDTDGRLSQDRSVTPRE